MVEGRHLIRWALAGAVLLAVTSGCAVVSPFKVAVGITADQGGSGVNVVEVELWKEFQCYQAPSDLQAYLDGERLTVARVGRMLSPTTRVRNADFKIPRCEPCLLRSRPFARRAPGPARLSIKVGRLDGILEVENLGSPRTARLLTQGPLVPGRLVQIQWLPLSDTWPAESHSAEVRFERQGHQPVVVQGESLQIKDGLFAFTMPKVPPGPVKIRLRPGTPAPRPPIRLCLGLGQCRVQEAGWPPPLTATVEGGWIAPADE